MLIGLASAGLTAVAGHQPWAHGHGSRASAFSTLTLSIEAGRVPGCTALSLVLLACWGVVLVTRGRVRRIIAWLGLLAALGSVVAVVLGFLGAPDDVRQSYAQFGITGLRITRSAWSFLAFPLVLVALVAIAAAVRLVPSWPEMGRRYDAPGAPAPGRPAVDVGDDQDDVTVWRAISEGRDPTL